MVSVAVTVKLKAVPVATLLGTLKVKLAAGPLTEIEFDVPAMEAVTVSMAVIVWPPKDLNVTEKLPTPLIILESAGRIAWASVLVICTVPV